MRTPMRGSYKPVPALRTLALAALVTALLIGVPSGSAQAESLSGVDLLNGLQESIERSRYAIVEDINEPGSYRAENPRQGFRAVFGAQGVDVAVRGAEAAALGMRLSGYGRAHTMKSAAKADIVIDDNRIEYRRGEITEWYVNSSAGIEQGFTLRARPEGDGELVVNLAMSGGFAAERSGPDLVFQGAATNLGYAKLHAFDSTGKPLPSRMEAVRTSGEQAVLLRVDDRGAVYPVIVDPILTNETIFYASSGFEWVGGDVAISGDTAVAGAHRNAGCPAFCPGQAYVYQRNSSGTWAHVRTLIAGDTEPGDGFGRSVAIDGDTIIIGAPGDNFPSAGLSHAGSAYLFYRNLGGANNWGQHKKIYPLLGSGTDYDFGASVAISADTVVVGAPGANINSWGADTGAAFVFERDLYYSFVGGYSTQADYWGERVGNPLYAPDGASQLTFFGDGFGSSVSISGDFLVVGAPRDSDVPNSGFTLSGGSAYMFQRQTTGNLDWVFSTKLSAALPVPSDWEKFGLRVAISIDVVVIAGTENKVRIFHNDPAGSSSWILKQTLTSSLNFGSDVAVSDDTAIIGRRGETPAGGPTAAGAAYVYQRDEGGPDNWGNVRGLFPVNVPQAAHSLFGTAVAISSGDDPLCPNAIVGAPAHDLPFADSGAAYVYSECTPDEFCGDGVVQAALGEQCDGADTGVCLGKCLSDCTCHGFCGDGIIQASLSEVCDPGAPSTSPFGPQPFPPADDALCPGLCGATSCSCPDPLPNHFKVYSVANGNLVVSQPVDVTDAFQTGLAVGTVPLGMYASPANKNSEGTPGPNEYQSWYQLPSDPDTLQPRNVILDNQFGTQQLVATNEAYLVVPSEKKPLPAPGTCTAPLASFGQPCAMHADCGHSDPFKATCENLQHFLCYNVLPQAAWTPIPVTLDDLFLPNQSLDTLTPKYFCNPAEKTPQGASATYPIVDPSIHLTCYDTSPKQPWDNQIQQRDQFHSSGASVTIIQNELMCVPSTKLSSQLSTQTPGIFCIDGQGTGSDWQWQIDASLPSASAVYTVLGPTPSPSTPSDLAAAFIASLNSSSIAGLSATSGPGAACFTIAYPQAFFLWVTSPGGPAACNVSGNANGCSFNPMIYEQAFLPVAVPGLNPSWVGAVAAAFLGAALLAVRRSRGPKTGAGSPMG